MADIHMGSGSLVDPLTDREQELLSCLVEGLSNQEIVNRLHLALSTVKWYNSQIYSKLGVKNRREAVTRATSLGLVPAQDVAERVTHNLPTPPSAFIGREQELAELAHLLVDNHTRLITILAPGGMGKTRLALEIASHLTQLRQFTDGIFFVPLQSLTHPHQIFSQIASSIDYQYGSDPLEPRQHLLDYLANKQMLLLMDNWEHLVEGAPLVTDLLQSAPGLRILATSRVRLNLSSEQVFPIRGMIFPDWETPGDALEYSAVKLFVQQARLARREFVVDETNLRYVARICRLTQGMPLGIVLAAAWLDTLSLPDISDEIQHSLDFLASEMRDLPERLHSVRAVFEYSWKRLQPIEQQVFMKLSVFRGGFTRQAAQAIADLNAPALQTLVNNALVTRETSGRYDIHELLRQYAEEQLERSGDATAVRDVHAACFARFMADRLELLNEQHQLEALHEIDTEFANVQEAWRWAAAQKHLDLLDQMLEGLSLYCEMRLRMSEAAYLFQQISADSLPTFDDQPHPIWGKLLLRQAGFLGRGYGFYEIVPPDAEQKIRQSLDIAERHHDREQLAACHLALGILNKNLTQDYHEAIVTLNQSLAYYERTERSIHTSVVCHLLSQCHLHLGEIDQALHYSQRQVDLCRQAGQLIETGHALHFRGVLKLFLGDYVEAEALHQEALALRQGQRNLRITAWSNVMLGMMAFFTGDFVQARRRAEETLLANQGYVNTGADSIALFVLGYITCVEGDYPQSAALCAQSQSFPNVDTTIIVAAGVGRSLAACGLGDDATAWEQVRVALKYGLPLRAVGLLTWCLPVIAILLTRAKQPERAVEILGLAFTYPPAATGWMRKWKLLTALQNDLKTKIGEEGYKAAWEHGESLAIAGVIQELLENFESVFSET